MKSKLLVAAFSIVLLSWPRTAAAVDCSTFGGRATTVQANVLGIVPVVLSDTGNLDSTGGAKQASLLNASVAGLLSAQDLHATAIGGGSNTRAESSLANLVLNVAGNTIGADFVMARANAACGTVSPTVDGITEIHGLVVNGQSIPVSGLPNQVVSLVGGGLMTINERTSAVQGQIGSITTNALHLRIPAVIDAVIATVFVVISGPPDPFVGPPPPLGDGCDFITGGGWIITPTGGKGTFGVSGGIRHFVTFGHLEYHDQSMGINVHGTGVFDYGVTDVDGIPARFIQGNAEVNGVGGYTYTVIVSDNGEPGVGDIFMINLVGPPPPVGIGEYTAGSALMGTPVMTLGGGNIQLHTKCCGGN